VLPPGASRPPATTRRWTLAIAVLLALHVLLAWLALQAVFVVVEVMWRVVAGREELRPLLSAHVDQFHTLRWLQGVLWVVTGVVFVGWVGRAVQRRVVWWWVLLVAAVVSEAAARILAVWSGGPLDFGPAMAVLAVGQLLTIAAAVVGIALVLGADTRQAARARDPGAV
jgi:hypothetical protein